MKTLNTKSKLIAIAALVVIAAVCAVFHIEQRAQAQDHAPPVPDRISFGMVGITRGQTARINVSNLLSPPQPDAELPPSPIRVEMMFVDGEGNPLLNNEGNPIRRVVMLEPGRSAFLQINANNLLGRDEVRLNFRAVVTVIPPRDIVCPCSFPATVEVVNNATGRTEWVLSGEHFRIPPPVHD